MPPFDVSDVPDFGEIGVILGQLMDSDTDSSSDYSDHEDGSDTIPPSPDLKQSSRRKRLSPEEWLASLRLQRQCDHKHEEVDRSDHIVPVARLLGTPSLHADYKEATFNGDYKGSAVTGGIEDGLYRFTESMHDWDEEDRRTAIQKMTDEFAKLVVVLKSSRTIPAKRAKVVFDGLPLNGIPSSVFENIGTTLLNFEKHVLGMIQYRVYHLRDIRESLPRDPIILKLFDSSTIMAMVLHYNKSFGSLPTFQIGEAVSPPHGSATHPSSKKKVIRSETFRALSTLEERFTAQFGIAFARYPLEHFCRWASYEQVDSDASIAVGSVKSIHLFRGLKGLEHEFVLINFANADSQTTSWMRVERAARAKRSRIQPRFDSFGPLNKGVPPLDTISFGVSREDLYSKLDHELGSIVVETPSTEGRSNGVLTGIYIREIAEQLTSIAHEFPRYCLWTTNCRFFARRVMINVAIRFAIHYNTVPTYKWPHIAT